MTMRMRKTGIRIGAVVVVMALVISGCDAIDLLQLYGRPSPEVLVDNSSATVTVIEVVEETGSSTPRFYFVAPGQQVAVDSTGEANPPAYQIRVLDHMCELVKELSDLGADGGIVRIATDMTVTFEAGYEGTANAEQVWAPTCEAASS